MVPYMNCGIIAVTTKRNSLNQRLGRVVEEALRHLEYRGYDSVGVAIVTFDRRLVVRKARGSIDEVRDRLGFDELDGSTAIGHTRWATHGAPSDVNAHPHTDCSGRIAVVHNGIIENYQELRRELTRLGHRFSSETDTEVVPHLIEEFKRRGMDSYNAFKKAISMLRGAYAIVAIDLDSPQTLFFARMTSPLVIGFARGAVFIASDIPAFLRYTRRILVLRDGELGFATPESVYVEHMAIHEPASLSSPPPATLPVDYASRIRIVEWSAEMASKGGYPHYMLKEIHEQPTALAQTLAGLSDSVEDALSLLLHADKVLLIGAGTSYHAAVVGSLLLSSLAEVFSYPLVSSEARWFMKGVDGGSAVIAISQSGETIDTLLAVREARSRGARVIALCNVVDSAIPRESDAALYTRAGPEIGVAATKTFVTQVAVLTYLAVKLGVARGALPERRASEILGWLRRTPDLVSKVIEVHEERIEALAHRLVHKSSAYYLGRGLGLPISMEGALKLKEVAYIHAEAYPAGESKHGPIALVERGFPVIFTVTGGIDSEAMKSNIEEMRSRGAWTIGVIPKGFEELSILIQDTIEMPRIDPFVAPIPYIVPHQLLAYYTAVKRGYNPDKPRNLAKTVTVV